MNADALRDALRAQPFQPFSLQTADGRAFEVPHPEFAAMSRRTVYLVKADGSFSILDLMLVSSLDFKAEKSDSAVDLDN